MATKKGEFIKGVLGPLTLRELNGEQSLSTRPAKGSVKQTEATKKASDTFGMASALGSHIRHLFSPWIEDLYDPGMVNRLSVDLYQCLLPCRDPDTQSYKFGASSFKYLEGLDFNLVTPLFRYLGFMPVVSYDNGMIHIRNSGTDDLQKVRFPAKTTGCEIIASVAQFRLADGKRVFAPARKSMELTLDDGGADVMEFSFPVLEGCFCIVGIFLQYYSMRGRYLQAYNTKTFSPAGICGALIIPGKYQGQDELSWVKMSELKFKGS